MSKITTYSVSKETDLVLEELRIHFNLDTKAQVIKKAIALLVVAVEIETSGGKLIELCKDGTYRTIKLT